MPTSSFVDLRSTWAINLSRPVLIHQEFAGLAKWLTWNEPFNIAIMLALFQHTCHRGAFFVDSGANDGSWTIAAAAHGCAALAVEPQPECIHLLHRAVAANGFGSVQISQHILSSIPGVTIDVPQQGCKGQAQFLPQGKLTTSVPSEAAKYHEALSKITHKKPVVGTSFDWLVPTRRVALWHVDVEGAEILVLRSAAKALAEGRVRRILLEVTTHLWNRFNISVPAGLAELRQTFQGWACMVPCSGQAFTWDRSLSGRSDCAKALRLSTGVVDVYCTHGDEQTRLTDAGHQAAQRYHMMLAAGSNAASIISKS